MKGNNCGRQLPECPIPCNTVYWGEKCYRRIKSYEAIRKERDSREERLRKYREGCKKEEV